MNSRTHSACGGSAPPLQSSYGFCAPSLLRRISPWTESLWRFEGLWSPAISEKERYGTLAVNPMIRNPEFDYLFVLLTGLAVAFMLWVFWNLSKQIGRR
jgi:hypothetical protein